MRVISRIGVALAFAAISAHADATPITVDFSVHGGSSGPLAGVTANGYLTYDDSIIPAGGTGLGTADILSMSFTWNGIAYGANDAYQGLYFQAGTLTNLSIGNDCGSGFCQIGFDHTRDTWMLRAGYYDDFMYAIPWDCQCWASVFYGTSEFSVREASVPVPGTLSLIGVGLVGIPVVRRRFGRELVPAVV